MEKTAKFIGENIRARRESLAMKQKDLAKAAGISSVSINRLEKGHYMPRLANIQSIARALNCSVESLYKSEEPVDRRLVLPINLTSVGDLLERIAGLEPDYRRMIFALIYRDSSLVDGLSLDLSDYFDHPDKTR